jgi:hypothetical protein
MNKKYSDITLINILKQLILLAMFMLFTALFINIAKSNFKIEQKEVTIKLNLENNVNICLKDHKLITK